MYNIDTNLEK